MVEDNVIFGILDKYERFFTKAPMTGMIYYLGMVENKNLEKEIRYGKVIGDGHGHYVIRDGADIVKVKKHLCFHDYQAAERLSMKILVDELRLIS